jgi:hypothetical protein
MWKTGIEKCVSQTLEKVRFRFRIWKTENGKRETEKIGFANSQLSAVFQFSRSVRTVPTNFNFQVLSVFDIN